jgi:hypothetical protein
MMLRAVFSLFVVAVMAAVTSSKAGEPTKSANAQRFEALKQLAGDWVAADKDGKPTDKFISSIRVTAAGTAIQETLFPGSDKEMLTIYHLDGADLVLTHYCMLGNQPRMRAEPTGDVNKIAFKFIGGTNLKSNDEHHMHQATLTIAGKDRFTAEWVSCKDGKPCHQVSFKLVRKPK